MKKLLFYLLVVNLFGCQSKTAQKEDYTIVDQALLVSLSKDNFDLHFRTQNKHGEKQEDVVIDFYTEDENNNKIIFYSAIVDFGPNEIEYIKKDITEFIDEKLWTIVAENSIQQITITDYYGQRVYIRGIDF